MAIQTHSRGGKRKQTLRTPEPKAKRIIPEQEKCKMFFKSGNSTMLLCKGMTKLAANNLDIYIDRFCKQHGSKLEGQFIFTK